EAHQHPLRVANRRDHHVGPEARAVLAQPPAFVFELAISDRPLELPLRLSLGHVLRGIEAGEVPAENLLPTIAVGPFGPGVPADDPPLAIDQDDREVLYAVHHLNTSLYALPVVGIGPAPLGQVAGELGEAEWRALGIVQGRHK